MKIAILTHPPQKNYGGIMQALALSSFLQNSGHNCTIIFGPVKRYSLFKQFKEALRTFFGGGKSKQFRNLKNFTEKHLPLSEPWYGSSIPDCDCIIVGSDQVWRPKYTHLPGAYFLDFLPDDHAIKKIAYAASFGVDNWEFSPDQTERFSILVNRFDAVSVRESSGVELCKKYLHCPACQMPDPTLLHDAVFYRQIASRNNSKTCHAEKKTVFTYFLDANENKLSLAENFARETNLYKNEFMSPNKKALRKPVEEFISGIDQADFVLTDSFHGMVFSMIFGTPFAVIGNAKRGLTRFELAAKAGVPQAILNENASVDDLLKLYDAKQDYSVIKDFLKSEKARGRNFLEQHLKKVSNPE